MRCNLTLTALIALLIGISYYVQEYHKKSSEEEYRQKYSLIDLRKVGEIKRIRTAQYSLIRDGDHYLTEEHKRLVDNAKVDELLAILAPIRIVDTVSEESISKATREKFISSDDIKKHFIHFDFDSESVDFIIGQKLLFSRDYYMEVRRPKLFSGGKIVIVTDNSPDEGAYSEEIFNRHDGKYQKILALFGVGEPSFYDLNLYRSNELLHLKSVTYRMGREGFKVDLEKKETVPQPLNGIGYDETRLQDIASELQSIKSLRLFYPYESKLLANLIGTVEFVQEGRVEALRIFRKYGDLNGFFIEKKSDGNLYEVDSQMLTPLIRSVHYFWQLKILPFDPAEDLRSLNFEIAFNLKDKLQRFLSIPGKRLEVKGEGISSRVNHTSFGRLLSFLARRADMATTLLKSENDVTMGDFIMKFAFNKRIYEIYRNQMEIQLINRENNYRLHYLVGGDTPFPIRVEDYLNQ